MNNEEFAEIMKARSKKFALEVIHFLNTIPKSPVMATIRFQLIKSVTSTAANYRAACRARSNREFFAKISIVVEEADESQFWLEMIEGLELGNSVVRGKLLKEAEELVSIFASSRKTAGSKLKDD